jgi:hypothetical protein
MTDRGKIPQSNFKHKRKMNTTGQTKYLHDSSSKLCYTKTKRQKKKEWVLKTARQK